MYYDTANKWGHDLAGWKQPNNVLRRQTVVYTTEILHWVCEVLSPGTKWQDVQPSDKPSKRKRVDRLGSKFLTAQKLGVAHYWLVEPDVGQILVFAHDGPGSVGLLHHSLMVESHEPSLHIPPFASVNLQRVFEHLHVKPHKP
jgi:Uma2 family endonuclease